MHNEYPSTINQYIPTLSENVENVRIHLNKIQIDTRTNF